MTTVTKRIKEIKQPHGGYIKPSEFETIILDDISSLPDEENIHSSIIGLAVNYLTQFMIIKTEHFVINTYLESAIRDHSE